MTTKLKPAPTVDALDHEVQRGDIYQIDPSFEVFGGCLLIVDEIKSYGVMGYVTIPGDEGGNAFVIVEWEKIVWCGDAEWVIGIVPEGEENEQKDKIQEPQ